MIPSFPQADWHLNVRLGRAAEAFARGLSQLIPPASLRLFNPRELNQLLSGESDEAGAGAGMDVADMQRCGPGHDHTIVCYDMQR